jgi:predicted porin
MMKKSALFLAISAAAAAPAFAAEFQVNKDTKFQINVDVGAYHESVKNDKGVAEKAFTGKGLNQIEIKADHKVSADVTLFGEIEIDYEPIGDNGSVLTDDTRLGINSKSMGRFSIGQFDSYFEDNVIESLATKNGERANLTEAATDNDGRRLQWIKPLGPLTLAVEASRSTNSKDKTQTGTGFGVTGVYKSGPMTLAFGTVNINEFSSSGSASSNDKTTAASIKYGMGNLTLMGLVAKQDKVSGDKIDIMGAGLKYKMGDFNMGVAMQNLDETGKDKRTELSLGLGYKPFKNTTFYFDVLKADKANNAGDALEVGMKYKF